MVRKAASSGRIWHVLPVIAMVVFTVLAAAVYVVLPMLVGATVDVLGFSTKEAGLVAAADMCGASVAALVASLAIARCEWRGVLLACICLLTFADVLSGLASTFPMLVADRIVGGLGEGGLLAIGNASIAETRNPDRVFGLSLAGQLLFGSAALYCMPTLLHRYGLRGVFWSLAAFTLTAVALVRFMPTGQRLVQGSSVSTITLLLSRGPLVGLTGVLTYFIAQGGVWAYLDRIAAANHIETAGIGQGLATSSVAGLCGALTASWLDLRIGRLRPLLFSVACTTASLLLLNTALTFTRFASAASLFNFAWNLSVPYQFGALAAIDASRRTIALSGVAVFGGLTLGPSIAAGLIGRSGFNSVNWMGIILCIVSLLLFVRLRRLIEHASSPEEL